MGLIDAASEEAKNAGGENLPEYPHVETDEDTQWVVIGSNTVVEGTLPSLDEGEPVFTNYDEEYGTSLGIILDDAGVRVDADEGTENTVVVDEDESNTIRVFNEDEDDVEIKEDLGVTTSDGLYEGEVSDDIDEGRVILTINANGQFNVARRLDAFGETTATYDTAFDENKTHGLVEYAPPTAEDPEEYSAFARWPELRPSLSGERIAIRRTPRSQVDEDYAQQLESGEASYDSAWFTVAHVTDDGDEVLTPEDEVDGQQYSDNSTYLEWFDEHMELFYDGEDGGREDTELSDTAEEFVDEYIDGDGPLDEDTIRETAADNELDSEADAIVAEIEARTAA